MTSILNTLKMKIDMINKRDNIRFLDTKIHKNVKYKIL